MLGLVTFWQKGFSGHGQGPSFISCCHYFFGNRVNGWSHSCHVLQLTICKTENGDEVTAGSKRDITDGRQRWRCHHLQCVLLSCSQTCHPPDAGETFAWCTAAGWSNSFNFDNTEALHVSTILCALKVRKYSWTVTLLLKTENTNVRFGLCGKLNSWLVIWCQVWWLLIYSKQNKMYLNTTQLFSV